MNSLEEAAYFVGLSMDLAFEFIQAFVRAAVGCPQCQGTGTYHVEVATPPFEDSGDYPCESEHVQVPVLGVVVFAGPDKCEWRCDEPFEDCTHEVSHLGPGRDGTECGWQPRWDALFGEGQR